MLKRLGILLALGAACLALGRFGAAPLGAQGDLCAILKDGQASYPGFDRAPAHAVQDSQKCSVSGKTWRCELLFQSTCPGERRAKRTVRPGQIFGTALRTAETCFPDRIRKNVEFDENKPQRRRILREAHFTAPDKRPPVLVVAADTIKHLKNDEACESTRIEVRWQEQGSP